MLRRYPYNSPEAAARILALTAVADGRLGRDEVGVLERLRAHEQLGLAREEFYAVLHTFCEDLLAGRLTSETGACRVDAETLAAMMAEIDDDGLRARLLDLCASVAEADAHLAEGESTVLAAAIEHWGLQQAVPARSTQVPPA